MEKPHSETGNAKILANSDGRQGNLDEHENTCDWREVFQDEQPIVVVEASDPQNGQGDARVFRRGAEPVRVRVHSRTSPRRG